MPMTALVPVQALWTFQAPAPVQFLLSFHVLAPLQVLLLVQAQNRTRSPVPDTNKVTTAIA